MREAEADHGEDLVEALEDGGRDAGRLELEAPGEIAQQAFGLRCVVLLPGLAQSLLDAGVQMLVKALDDVSPFVDLTASASSAASSPCRIDLAPAGGRP